MSVYLSNVTSSVDQFRQRTEVNLIIDEDIEIDDLEERFNQAFLGSAVIKCQWCNSGNAFDNGNCTQCGGAL